MSSYLLVESRDPFEIHDVLGTYELAAGLAKQLDKVTLLLVEARESTASHALASLAAKGVTILADEFALRERGIDRGRLVNAVKPAPLETVIDHLEQGDKVLWH
jgi:predicted peroxiredoxin